MGERARVKDKGKAKKSPKTTLRADFVLAEGILVRQNRGQPALD
jgi:hypothetical protein